MAARIFFLQFLILAVLINYGFGLNDNSTRKSCGDDAVVRKEIHKKVNTTERLARLRTELKKENISAYIILSGDAHQSEYISEHDKRRAYISGFTGSAGNAVVTLNSAALWTDSRYYIQADEQMDCNWILMKSGEGDTPSIDKWIIEQLESGEFVSTDPRISPSEAWLQWNGSLSEKNLTLKINDNLVDRIWGVQENRPPYPDTPITVLDLKYAGQRWQDKLKQLRKDMEDKKIDTLIVTALDEVAWTLNLRGGDVPFTPVFRSYLIIQPNKTTVYFPKDKSTDEIIEHLNANDTEPEESVQIKDYEDIWLDLLDVGQAAEKIGLPSSFVYSGGVSYLIYSSLPENKITRLVSPALLRKDVKNPTEAIGMRNSHIRDAVALCQFFAKMEEEITTGATNWTELTSASYLDNLRTQQNYSLGPSFGTISAFGINAAMPHYAPTPETDVIINSTQLYLVDSGGQYFDGTTDVTRTLHFGEPRDIEREVYTRLLTGCIDIASVTFKEGYGMKELEILIRAHLYESGLDYGHGSTHGIGSFLSVHESFNSTYHINFFGSQEPGYYRENDFGMRLENIVTVVEANVTGEMGDRFLTFDTVTVVPYEKKLIKVDMLERKHVKWLNEYHEKIRKLVGDEMLNQGLIDLHDWLINKTEPIYI